MTARNPEPRVTIRIAALVGVALWLAAVSFCSIEPMWGCGPGGEGHDHPGDVTTASHHEGEEHAAHDYADTARSHREESGGDDSHNHGDHETVCCSTLNATAPSGYETVLAEPVWHPSAFPDADLQIAFLALEQRQRFPNRHARSRDVVLTPVVCTEPANPSHAPPVFI